MQNQQAESRFSLNVFILFALLLVVIVIISLMASVPPVSRDALTHHLAVPKLYLKNGGIYEIPHLYFSYFPMNVTLLYAIPLYFDNDIVPKFIHFVFALATALLIYRYLARRIDIKFALLGTIFFLSIPVIVRLSTTAYVDLGLIFFLFASMLYLFDWIDSDFRIKYLLISAVFCGLAIGTKYNGLVGLALLGLFVPFVYSRYKSNEKYFSLKALGHAAIFITVSLVVFSPWMIRNVIWTGNPVHPLYSSIFIPKSQTIFDDNETEKKATTKMNHLQIRRDIYDESTLEIILVPIRVFFQGKDDTPKYFDGRLNPFLLLLVIISIFGIKTDSSQMYTEKMILFFYSILFLLIACSQASIRIRYFSPIVPPLVVLSMYGLYNIQIKFQNMRSISEPIKKLCISVIILVMLGLNGSYMVSLFYKIKPIQYITGQIARDEYIQHFRPEYASMQYANQNLSKDSKILGIYLGNRGYYSDIDIVFSLNLLRELAADAWSARDISHGLRERNITHLLVNYELFNFWVKNYSLHEKQMLKDFFEQQTVTEFSKDKYGLLRVL